MRVYADNAATTAVSDTALAAMQPCFQEIYGNPSSLHSVGQAAAEKLSLARQTFASRLHCSPNEITFTSGGSEADNQALRLAAQCLYPHALQSLLHRWVLQSRIGRIVEPRHDGFWRACRGHDAKPGNRQIIKRGIAQLLERRHLRQGA